MVKYIASLWGTVTVYQFTVAALMGVLITGVLCITGTALYNRMTHSTPVIHIMPGPVFIIWIVVVSCYLLTYNHV